jgi:hypothetical protein
MLVLVVPAYPGLRPPIVLATTLRYEIEVLKSEPDEENHGKVQPIRSRYAASLRYGARETATSVTSRAFR